MTFSRSSRQISLGAAALAVGGLLVCNAQPQGKQRGRPIEFSLPRGEAVSTNLQQLMSKPDDLKQWQEELYKPPQSFEPQSSLDGVVALPVRPPATPAIQNKRVKELLERRKNWVFISPEDLLAAPTVDEILKTPELGPDGQEQKELPALQRFYQRLATKRSPTDNLLQPKTDGLFGSPGQLKPPDDLAVHDDPGLPSGLRETAQALQKLFEPGSSDSPFVQGAPHGNLYDTFGLGNNTLSKDQVEAHKKFMDDYRTVLDPTWHPPAVAGPGDPLATLADTTSPSGKPSARLPGLPSTAPPQGLDAQADILNPTLGPPALPDVNAQALGQTKPALALPQVAPTRVMPAAPSFDAPRRSFH
jgi:hypothetical protein